MSNKNDESVSEQGCYCDECRCDEKLKAEISELRKALWDFVDVSSSVGPVQYGSACWHHAKRVLGDRRSNEKHGREQ